MKRPSKSMMKNPKMRFGAPVAKAAKGGFLGGMAEGMAAGAQIGSKAKTARRERELMEKGAFAKDTIYARRGGMVKCRKK